MNTIPRRIRLDRLTSEELAIHNIIEEVEKLGAHPLLTDVVVLLGEAQDKLSDWVELEGDAIPAKKDPMDNHKCVPIAKVRNMGDDREWWMGRLLEPIPDHPQEKWCLHIKTPYKSVVWGVNGGDMNAYAVLAQIAHKEELGLDKGINPTWLDAMEGYYRNAAAEINVTSEPD